jgi:hypothetical protein
MPPIVLHGIPYMVFISERAGSGLDKTMGLVYKTLWKIGGNELTVLPQEGALW